MVDVPLKQLPDAYAYLMRHIKERLLQANTAIQEADKKYEAGDQSGLFHLEFAHLQLRKCSEHFAFAVLLAHHGYTKARTRKMLEHWNADALIGMLAKINVDGFPRRLLAFPNEAWAALEDDPDGMKRSEFKRMYSDLGERLHSGSLQAAIGAKKRQLDISEANSWLHRFVGLFERHLITLPQSGFSMTMMLVPGSAEDPTNIALAEPACAIWKHELLRDDKMYIRCLYKSEHFPAPKLAGPPPTM